MRYKFKKIRSVFFEDTELGWCSAQCLEYDIAAQAKTFNDLLYELQRVMVGHVVVSEELCLEPFEHLKPAPAKFWRLYDESKVHVERKDPHPFDLQDYLQVPPSLEDVRVAEMEGV